VRLFAALGLFALVACSAAFSLGVADFSVRIANTLGRTCWVKVDTAGSPVISAATYLADATYDSGALALSDSVTVQFFGRREAPADTCTAGGEVDDLPLSAAFKLKREASQPIAIGGATYGEDLGGLVNAGVFWLGATAAGNVGLGEELRFKNGRITVGF